jgi:hypothetical protein
MRDTIDMALEAGFDSSGTELTWESVICTEELKAFEALVRADEREQYKWDIHSCGPTCKRYACVAMREAIEAEREACAKLADQLTWADNKGVASAIRARGNT